MKALTDLNFDQIENFVEYEAYHSSSYFNYLLKQVLTLADFLENASDFSKSYLDNMKDQVISEANLVSSDDGLATKTRT